MEMGILIQQCGHKRSRAGRMTVSWTLRGTKTQAPKTEHNHIENPGMDKQMMLGQGFIAM